MTNDPAEPLGPATPPPPPVPPPPPAHAPAGYGASPVPANAPGQADPAQEGSPPAVPPGGPVYGRVHRYGPPATPSTSPRQDAGGARDAGAAPDGGRAPDHGAAPESAPPVVAPRDPGGWAPPATAWPPPTGPGAPPVGPPGAGGWGTPPPVTRAALFPPQHYASWPRRALGWLVDSVPSWVGSVLVILGYIPVYAGLFRGDFLAQPSWGLLVAGLVLSVAAFGWTVYNRWFLAGRTGQSLGRRLTKTWLVDRATGRPIGMLFAFVRDLLHVLDRPGFVGYIWPLWDPEKQTLADKIAQTVVIRTPVPPLQPGEPMRRV